MVTAPTSTSGELVCSLVLRLSTEEPDENNLCLKLAPVSPEDELPEDLGICGGGGGAFILACCEKEEEFEIGGGGGEAGILGAPASGRGGADKGGGVGGRGGADGGDWVSEVLGDVAIALPWRLCLIEEAISLKKPLPPSDESPRLGGGADGIDGDGTAGTGGADGEGIDETRDETFLGGFCDLEDVVKGTGGAVAAGRGGAAVAGLEGGPLLC